VDTSTLDRVGLLGRFPAARAALPAGGDPVVATASLMCDHMMAFEFIAQGMISPGTHVPRDATSLADGAAAALPHRKLQPGAYPQQWTCDGPLEMGPVWHPLWDRCVAEYNAGVEKLGGRSVLGYLFSRFGSDCGRIMTGMHDARVSWGTYQVVTPPPSRALHASSALRRAVIPLASSSHVARPG
jgi:hypothetical protein